MVNKMGMRTPKSSAKVVKLEPASYLGKIVDGMSELTTRLVEKSPDARSNQGKRLGELFLWKEIVKYAEGRYEKEMKAAEAEGLIVRDSERAPGQYVLAESGHFVVMGSVTEKIRRFNADVLAEWMFKKYKVPVMETKEAVEKSKVPTASALRVSIVERK